MKLCPFCLQETKFTYERPEGSPVRVYRCPKCKEPVPPRYVREYRRYPPVVVSAIGFPRHGKTVYFASLFYLLKESALAQHWKGFHAPALDDDSLVKVYENVDLLKSGRLPPSTPQSFPRPAMVRMNNIPIEPDCTLLIYDTSGEAFRTASGVGRYAHFVKNARTAMFLISLDMLTDPRPEMDKLVTNYTNAMASLGGNTHEQHLLVVYAKADELGGRLQTYKNVQGYLTEPSLDGLLHPHGYVRRMHRISAQLREFTRRELEAYEFLSHVDSNFKSVSFSMISALGARPDGDRLPVQVTPRRVLDPILWMMEKSLSWSRRAWHRLLV